MLSYCKIIANHGGYFYSVYLGPSLLGSYIGSIKKDGLFYKVTYCGLCGPGNETTLEKVTLATCHKFLIKHLSLELRCLTIKAIKQARFY